MEISQRRSLAQTSPGSRTTPTYDDGSLYHMNPAGRLAAYDAQSGQELWNVELKSEFDAEYGIWALAENVIVDGGKVLCMPGGPKGRIVALDKRTGKTLWANTEIEHSAAYCSPVVVTYRNVRQLITMTQKSVLGVDVETGRLVWSALFVPKSPQDALTPVFQDGHVFVACGHSSGGTLMKIDPDSRTASTVWHREDLDNCHGGAIVLDGKLFGCGCRQGGKSFYCVEYLTGETIKLDKTLGKVGITCADDMIYCLNHQGTMSLLAVTSDGFDIVSQFNLKRKPVNSYLAHPVICGGKFISAVMRIFTSTTFAHTERMARCVDAASMAARRFAGTLEACIKSLSSDDFWCLNRDDLSATVGRSHSERPRRLQKLAPPKKRFARPPV